MTDQVNAKRSFGRNLSDFGELKPAEQELLRSAESGRVCHIAKTKLENASPENTLRADFIRFLALGGDKQAPIHETGVWLVGGWIEGVLNLDFCRLPSPLRLQHCRLMQLCASGAEIPMLSLSASQIDAGINADGIQITGAIFLNADFVSKGTVRLLGATIGGNLECDDGQFNATSGPSQLGAALAFDTATITGSAFLRRTTANGTVRLPGANIGGSLECDGASFNGNRGVSLNAESARVQGSVFLRNIFVNDNEVAFQFTATGMVLMPGVIVGGNLDCAGGNFETANGAALALERAKITQDVLFRKGFKAKGTVRLLGINIGGSLQCNGGSFEIAKGDALSCNQASIKGGLFLNGGFAANGIVRFTAAHIGSLIDADDCWPARGQLMLDGVQIDRFAGTAPTSGAARVAWLQRQVPDYLGADFRPQPWEETIRVLRAMGHDEDARFVAIAKQEQLRKAGQINGLRRDLHWAWGALAGYGYQPLKLVSWMVGVWLLCGTGYLCAETFGRFAPTNPVIHTNGQLAEACTSGPGSGKKRWTACEKMPDAYTTFSPFWYSADVLLPVVDLQQVRDWAPVVTKNGARDEWGEAVRWLMWLEILFGWVTSLMLVAILTNLIKKD